VVIMAGKIVLEIRLKDAPLPANSMRFQLPGFDKPPGRSFAYPQTLRELGY